MKPVLIALSLFHIVCCQPLLSQDPDPLAYLAARGGSGGSRSIPSGNGTGPADGPGQQGSFGGGDILAAVHNYFRQDPVMAADRQCFSKLPSNNMIEFLIDIAANPDDDATDNRLAGSPMAKMMSGGGHPGGNDPFGGMMKPDNLDAAKQYFTAIKMFIEHVTIDIPAKNTLAIIYNNREKLFIQGRLSNSNAANVTSVSPAGLKALNTRVNTSSARGENQLARLTKLALEARNNGLPVVLEDKRPTGSSAAFRFIITDGSSGAAPSDLTDEATRTSIIDIGGRRFLSKLTPSQIRTYVTVHSLYSPEQMIALMDTARFLACEVGIPNN